MKKSRIKQKRITLYYLNHLYCHQSYHSRILKYFIYRVLILLISFLVFFYFSEGRFLASFASSFSVLIIYHIIVKLIEQKRLQLTIEQVNEKLATEEFWKRIKSMEKDSFVFFVKEILSNLPGFSEIEITDHLESEGINIICKYKEELIAVQCHLLDDDNAVEARSARELSRAMSRRKYKKGIIISTTDFRNETKEFCNLIKDKREIKLLDKKFFVQMVKDAGKFLKEDEVNNLILRKIEHNERLWQEAREKLFDKPRILPYFLYGSVLLILSIIINSHIKYFYYTGALVLYMLGIIGVISTFNNKQKKIFTQWNDQIR
ncbi:MAG: hypothetical protein PWQ67_879 [Clostridia bacterium]|jgi:hypothetical protein|nr:hypothetical protein [Clostridia bacterium]MDN5322425.1 hypothetical protein [Clostridia bacterium]